MGTGTGALINEAFSEGHVLLPLNFFSTYHFVKKNVIGLLITLW